MFILKDCIGNRIQSVNVDVPTGTMGTREISKEDL